jgi:poly(ADP-ribose) glycohydrolase ARH3
MIVDRAVGSLIGTFVGDALGMPFEGLPRPSIPRHVEMIEARLGRGTYTDDTQMMIALAESLNAQGRVDGPHLANAFLDAYEVDRGYGNGTRRVFDLWRSGIAVDTAATQVFDGQGSRGNGAAMRIAPVAVLFRDDRERVCVEAAASARITHAHPVGIDGAVVQAAAIGAALRGEDILRVARATASTPELGRSLGVVEELLAVSPQAAAVHRGVTSSADAAESVAAALYSALAHDRFETALQFAVRLGGDTDTVAAMAGAVAGARNGYHSIPPRWLAALEDGERGHSYVRTLATALCGDPARYTGSDRGNLDDSSPSDRVSDEKET